ncbi:MAG: peroxiredoxin [Thermoplasmatales archaeon]
MTLRVGDKAPDFTAISDDGTTVSLSDKLKEGPVVLYFYPKDETPGCGAEACAFRDNWEEIRKLGATVIGVSSDSVESHRQFKENRKLQFTLLSDPKKEIRKKYDATGSLLPPRITYVIDKNGIIREVYNSQLNATMHAQIALKALKSIEK